MWDTTKFKIFLIQTLLIDWMIDWLINSCIHSFIHYFKVGHMAIDVLNPTVATFYEYSL